MSSTKKSSKPTEVDPTAECMKCGTPVPDYEARYCCSGRECGCYGLPLEPPLCEECATKFYSSRSTNE